MPGRRWGAIEKKGSKTRTLRATRGWSQADLAEQLGVSRQTVNAIENGRYDPSLPLAFSISAAFEKSIEEVFFPNGTPVAPAD